MKFKSFIILFITIILILIGIGVYRTAGYTEHDWLKIQMAVFPDSPKVLLRMADNLQRQEGFEADLKEYKNILRLQAEGLAGQLKPDPEVVNRVQQVLTLYKKVISLDPENLQAHYRLGVIAEKLGLIPVAFSRYLEVAKIEPSFVDVHYRLAELYMEVGDHAQAATAFKQVLILMPEDEVAYMQVIDMISRGLEKEPENNILRHSRREVVEKFTEIINKKKKTAELYYNLGVVLARIGETERAVSAYRSALDLDDRHVGSLNNLGNMYLKAGKAAEAEKLFKRALEFDKNLIEARMNLGVIQAKQGDIDAARKTYRKIVELDPSNGQAYFKLGYLEEAAGRLMAAKDAYGQAMKYEPDNAEIYYNAGNVHIKLGLGEKALQLYAAALQRNINHTNAAVNGCLLSAELKEWEKAKKFCSEAEILGYQVPEEIKSKL